MPSTVSSEHNTSSMLSSEEKKQKEQELGSSPLAPLTADLSAEGDADLAQVPKPESKSDAETGEYLHGTQLALCFAGLMLTNFLVGVDTSVSVTIQSAVEQRFQSFNNIGWLVSGFVLPVTVLSMIWGRASMLVGRRIVIFTAIIIFELGSLICALATSMDMLIGGRAIAGIGGAGTQSTSFLIILDIMAPNERAFGNTLLTIAFVFASVIGPLIGGLFANSARLTWRWAFYINLPIGAAALLFMMLGYRKKPPSEWEKFKKGSAAYKIFAADLPGALLVSAGLILLLLALSFGGNEYAWNSAAVICCFTIGGLILIGYVLYTLIWFDKITAKIQNDYGRIYPLFTMDIAKNYKIMCALMALLFLSMMQFGIILFVTTYFEIILSYDPLKSSLHLLPLILSATVSALFTGVLTMKTGYVKPFIVISGVSAPLGAGLMLVFKADTSFSAQVGLLIPAGVSYGLMIMPVLLSIQLEVKNKHPHLENIVTAFYTFIRSIGSAIASNLATAVFVATVNSKKEHYSGLEPYTANTLMAYSTIGIDLSNQDISDLKKIMMASLKNVFYISLAFSCVACVLSFFASNKKMPVKEKGKRKGKDEIEDEIKESETVAVAEQQQQESV